MATRYRNLISPTLLDTSAPDTGASDVAGTLAQSLSSFQRHVHDIGIRLQTERGRQAGAEEGMAGTARPRRGLAGLTAFGRAYNNAAEAAYAARAQQDIHETISRIELEVDGDDAAFEARVKGYADEITENTPEEFRPRVDDLLRTRVVSGRIRVQEAALAKHRDQQKAAVLESMGARMSGLMDSVEHMDVEQATAWVQQGVAENDAQIDALVESGAMRASEAVGYKQKFRDMAMEYVATAHLNKEASRISALARGNIEDAMDALAELEADPTFDDAEKNAIRKAVKEDMGLLTFERSRQYAAETAALAQRLEAGEHGEEVERLTMDLWRKGAISNDALRSNFAASARNRDKAITDGADIQAVSDLLAAGQGLDPASKKQAAALNKLFEQAVKEAGAVPGDDRWQATAIDLARRSNVLPDAAQSWARVSMLSSDPLAAARGAAFYTKAKAANPAAFKWAEDPRMDAFAEQLNDNIRAGIDPERSYEIAHRNVYEVSDGQRKVLEALYRANDGQIPKGNLGALRSALNDEPNFDPASPFVGVPDVPLAMQVEYDQLVERYFGSVNGDVEKARALAAKAVKSTWGVTTVNGERELVKFPPEARGVPAEVVRSDVAATAAEVGHTGAVRLSPNAFTDSTQGLVWTLTAPDEFGVEDILRDANNQPVLYRVPMPDDRQYAEAVARAAEARLAEFRAKDEAVMKSRSERDARLLARFGIAPEAGN